MVMWEMAEKQTDTFVPSVQHSGDASLSCSGIPASCESSDASTWKQHGLFKSILESLA